MEFYGGKNPAPADVQTASATQTSQLISPSPTAPSQPVSAQKIVIPKNVVTPPSGSSATVQKRSSWMIPAIVCAVVILGGGGFAAWWFFVRAEPASDTAIPPPPVVAETPSSVPPVVEEPPALVLPPQTPEVKKPEVDLLIAPHAYKDSPDGDTDGMTDIEEELWGTNGALADSDADTFADTVELQNLYNPKGVAPQRLIDAQLVNTYVNPEYQYTVYYPISWLSSSLEESKKEVLFTSITQEYVQVAALPFPAEQTFTAWFAATFPNESLITYVPFTNKYKVSGVMSPDGSVAVITDGSHVYLLTYNGGSREEINYRATFQMMVQSFKTPNVTTPIDLLPTAQP
ncbi:MAG: hypothetical protein A3C15_00430 [Candidatus Magasanikbacteria bacterium RIFCSPHIGHO2_02_FULL_50_9b]|uniref:Uncharacterized protein n=1 Tax=Candidatus Magasanikbacteria bacterium RIFCSPHIGHO2_02_FULL_50_9b TaxID=1798682 RepID=A0A1F6M8K7_9BACT|nr:MAG: hypothetical protein A3C15_00430 [Candidatus Magasanikbacteria bacterium RIFCSPHIGHO2_02_FULL_50_9b]